jgi:hypothetical protein
MSTSKGQVRIKLTPEQKAMIKNATGKNVEEVELEVMELEERIAPSGCAQGSHFPKATITV